MKYRSIYFVEVEEKEARLGGYVIAIVDQEKFEVVLLTYGDTFEPKRCGDY